MTGLAKVEGAQLAQRDNDMSQEQIDIIRNTIAKGATNTELDVFVQTCKRLRLDPFARQIFLVKRYDSSVKGMVAQPQVSIDGLRLVAERTGKYRGQTAPEWCGKDGKWTDVWLSSEPPAAARVGVYREGFAAPLVRVARYESYVQTTMDRDSNRVRPNAMWQKMPEVMLSKCSEALALRAAFPNELSGVYTSDEMGQAESDAPVSNNAASRALARPRNLDDVAQGGGTQRPFVESASSTPTRTPTTAGTTPTTSSTATIDDAEFDENGETPLSALLSEYAACVDMTSHAQLEEARKAMWTTLSPAEKRSLKEASDSAAKAIAEAENA